MSKFGIPTEEQLAKINNLAKRNFTADDVFAFGGKAAGDMIIENRYIQLSKELLETFLKNSREGVSWLLNHSWSTFSEPTTIFGRTFDGSLEPSSEPGETVALYLDKYIPRSDTLKNGRSANSIIEDIENGVLFDTSIGWGSSKMVCSVCNMDYYGGGCNHYKGQIYEDADGNKKTCFIIAKNPGYLMEESGVFDGAYKGAGISMSSVGDEFETPQGKFIIIDELKELPKNANVFGSYSSKGEILTFVKKSEPKKVFAVKGAENNMDKLIKMLEAFGITYKEGETKLDDTLLNQLAEQWDAKIEEIKSSVVPVMAQLDPTADYMTQAIATEKLGVELSADEVLKLAKEGQVYHQEISDEALAMGVRAMANEFPAETWKNAFSTMSTQSIKDIMKTWEVQAKVVIPSGRATDPEAGQNFAKEVVIPDEAFKVKK